MSVVRNVLDDGLGGIGLACVRERQAMLELFRRDQHLAQGLARHPPNFRERGRLRVGPQPDFHRAARHAR